MTIDVKKTVLTFEVNGERMDPDAYFRYASHEGLKERLIELFKDETERDKMYLLLEGQVSLSAKGQPVGAVKVGDIFVCGAESGSRQTFSL